MARSGIHIASYFPYQGELVDAPTTPIPIGCHRIHRHIGAKPYQNQGPGHYDSQQEQVTFPCISHITQVGFSLLNPPLLAPPDA